MKRKKLIWVPIIILLLLVGGIVIYLNKVYPAMEDVQIALRNSTNVTVYTLDNHDLVFEPKAPTKGLIFYPGAQIDYTAYAPLMRTLAEEGILGVLVQMPCNLAVFDINAADGLQARFPYVNAWYIGGHSLGGAMAANYVAKHPLDFKGLVLLAAYATSDLSQTNLDVLSIYGTNDHILNRESYEANKKNLPASFEEYIIEGGSHAYFGSYGLQKGDGIPTISNSEQIQITSDIILRHILASHHINESEMMTP